MSRLSVTCPKCSYEILYKSSGKFKVGSKFTKENASLRAKRATRASELQEQGQSYKQAWFNAFQDFPRKYVDVPSPVAEDDEASPGSPNASDFVYPPRV